jgi:hypothetical protein
MGDFHLRTPGTAAEPPHARNFGGGQAPSEARRWERRVGVESPERRRSRRTPGKAGTGRRSRRDRRDDAERWRCGGGAVAVRCCPDPATCERSDQHARNQARESLSANRGGRR